eukprot:GFUD01056487.1.p1 GENE.GFUD01056487.1~~GFUD01056487.1.p1  ORF type:complete len:254 (+),score=63.58 GFUD01056487.1:198-959(+)
MCSVVVISVIVMLSKPAKTVSSSTSLSCPCSDPFSHCDEFENRCVHCKEICENQNTFSDCQADCPNYLQSVIFRQNVEKDDLQTLTILVAITAAMTSVVMVAVCLLISMKMKKRHRLRKKILPSSVFTVERGKVEIDIPETDKIRDTLVIRGSVSQRTAQCPPSHVRPPLKPGTSLSTSLSTLDTQLSQQPSMPLPSKGTTITTTNSRNPSGRFGKMPRRLPSEDCVPEVGGRCNPGRSPVPGEERGRAYTAL